MIHPSHKYPTWSPPAVIFVMAVLVFFGVHWQQSAEETDSAATTPRQARAPLPSKAPPTQDEAQAVRRELLAEVETNGLAALVRIDESWPDSLRRSLRRDLLEHHGIQQPLESLDWLAKHPRIEGSGPFGVELSSSLHARAGLQAGKAEPWQTAFERLDKIATHGTQREHLAYLQPALTGMRNGGMLPFSAREIHSMRLRPEAKAVALASLGDLRGGLDLLRPGGADYAVAHLATREWLTLGKLPLSFSETADRLLALAPPGDKGPAQVAQTLRHPSLDRAIAVWLRSHPAGPGRDEMLNEIAAEIALSDPSFARPCCKHPIPTDPSPLKSTPTIPIMNTRSVRSGLLAIALAAGLSPHGHAQGLDETLLNISLREDPVYPVPEIGQRRFYCRYQSESGWSDPRMILRFASQTSALENTFAGAPGVTEIPAASITQQELGGSVRQAEWIMPWRKRNPGAANLQGPPELFADGSSGFYQWVVEYVADGSTKRLFGDVHTFTQPRRLVFGVMGDSFGSGEGAPAVGSTPWINTAGHRSAVSGSEIALSLLRNNYPHLAFDYFNTTSSGAIAHDIWSETGQASRAGSDGQGIGTPQAKLLEAFLAKPEKDHHYNSYTHVDAIILSCGGNDFGFSTIVEHYFGVPALGMETTAALCIPALVIGGIPGFVGCMGLSILADYSFEQGNEAPFVSEGKWRHFPFYRDRLKGQYEKLEKRLVRDLRPGTDPERQTTAKVHQFLVTEYPNPLKPCKNHWNTKSYSTFRTLSGPFSA